ncbi:transcriptional regulator [Ktedonobacter robiniae]|uniref:Uncharacterized protein n=1 Tax=Ktedonobacter robiniae TaxID=2778365 RepID=A0ABQ3V2H5_9CHLR|nr:transcriptional regulator [Ktedonobacter robiniae]GHO59183.1 hypothetical protein KSB_76580 [Ktedonobacter robiniae]
MRLVRKEEKITAIFTLPWEVAYLVDQEEQWVPLFTAGGIKHIGEIHTKTYEVHLVPGELIIDRQVVVLGPPQHRHIESADIEV